MTINESVKRAQSSQGYGRSNALRKQQNQIRLKGNAAFNGFRHRRQINVEDTNNEEDD